MELQIPLPVWSWALLVIVVIALTAQHYANKPIVSKADTITSIQKHMDKVDKEIAALNHQVGVKQC